MNILADKETGNIEEQLNHLATYCSLFAQSYSYLSQTEVGAEMNNVLLGVRRLENNIEKVAKRQERTLLNVVPFKIKDALQLIGHIKSDISLTQPLRDKGWEEKQEVTDWDELIRQENKTSPFTIGDDYDDYHKTRYFLTSKIEPNCEETNRRLDNIIRLIREIELQNNKIEGNIKTQRDLYNNMVNEFRENDWRLDRDSFIQQEREALEDEENKGKDKIDILKKELLEIKQTHLNSYMPNYVKKVYRTVLNQRITPYEAIVRQRNKLSEDDITDYFSFLFRFSTLKEYIESIPLLMPLTDRYKDLFTCRAAKEYCDLLSPVILLGGGIEEKGHFAILLMVMSDLGLAQIALKPYKEMMLYANEINKADRTLKFKEQSRINQVSLLFEQSPICELNYGEVGETGLDSKKIKELQDVYWRCFTILNQRDLRMPKEIQVASYLLKPHPDINLSLYMDNYTDNQLVRLNFLRSVLRRETLVFD